MYTLRLLLSVGLVLSGLLMPMTVAAVYVSPEEMLDAGDFSTRFLDPPPARRDYERVAAEQLVKEAAARDEVLKDFIGNGLPKETVVKTPVTEETTHAAAPAAQTQSSDVVDGTLPVRDARILERVKAQQEVDRLQAQLQWLAQTQTLHSGAPLMSDTGPATIGAVLLLFGTVALVLGRVRKMEKR